VRAAIGPILAGSIVLGLAGCVAPPAVSAPARSAAPEPLAPPAAAAPAPAAPATFTLSGEIEQGGAAIGTVPPGTQSLTFDGAAVPFAPDGKFLIAFDRDHGPNAVLVATLADGRSVVKSLAVAPRAWQISRLNSLPKFPVPSAEFERLRPPELAQIKAARALRTGADGWREQLIWPTTGRISTMFGAQRIYKGGEKGAYHSGIDIAVPTGTPIRAPADGVVILAADHPFTLEGNLLMIDHGMGLNSAFLHLSKIDVAVGEHVHQGQIIAQSGASGRATGPHLHWSLEWRGARIDPLLVAGPMPG
jgi:murein DD-endopeptidase MepM/ murein hydrolase activator NlpD